MLSKNAFCSKVAGSNTLPVYLYRYRMTLAGCLGACEGLSSCIGISHQKTSSRACYLWLAQWTKSSGWHNGHGAVGLSASQLKAGSRSTGYMCYARTGYTMPPKQLHTFAPQKTGHRVNTLLDSFVSLATCSSNDYHHLFGRYLEAHRPECVCKPVLW